MKKQIWDIRRVEWNKNMSELLKDGWEPFAVVSGAYDTFMGVDIVYFRKLVKGSK